MKSSARLSNVAITLETVEEGSSVSSTPQYSCISNECTEQNVPLPDPSITRDISSESAPLSVDPNSTTSPKRNLTVPATIHDDTQQTESLSRPKNDRAGASFSSLASLRRTPADTSGPIMTVETETISSVAQTALSGNLQDKDVTDNGGSVRGHSNTSDSVRPKRDRKYSTRKATSLHSGNASSKAEVFEAKVASAVDEANSTDSEETFVYESNPDATIRGSKLISRRSSAASMASFAGPPGKSLPGQSSIELSRTSGPQSATPPSSKRLVKFSKNTSGYSSDGEGEYSERSESTSRGFPSRNTVVGSIGHHHITSSQRSNVKASTVFARDELTSTSRTKRSNGSHRDSRSKCHHHHIYHYHHHHHHHHSGQNRRTPTAGGDEADLFAKRSGIVWMKSYEIESVAPNDERTPLLGKRNSTGSSGRVNSLHSSASDRDIESCINSNEQGRISRRRRRRRMELSLGGSSVSEGAFNYRSCALVSSLISLILIIVTGIVIIVLLGSRPMEDVAVRRIANVKIGRREIAFDLHVEAVNPGLFDISVSNVNLSVFTEVGEANGPEDTLTECLSSSPSLPQAWSTIKSDYEQHERQVRRYLVGRVNPLKAPVNFPGMGFWRAVSTILPSRINASLLGRDSRYHRKTRTLAHVMVTCEQCESIPWLTHEPSSDSSAGRQRLTKNTTRTLLLVRGTLTYQLPVSVCLWRVVPLTLASLRRYFFTTTSSTLNVSPCHALTTPRSHPCAGEYVVGVNASKTLQHTLPTPTPMSSQYHVAIPLIHSTRLLATSQ